MGVVQSSLRKAPIPKVPRAWKRERIKGTHWIYNGWIERGGKGSGKGTVEIPQFGCGWRLVALESEGRKWAHVVECGTHARAKVELELWQSLKKHGREAP